MTQKIAIIGMGVAGGAVLASYHKFYPKQKLEIDCYDDPIHFGKGIPFRPDSSLALNNSRSDAISFDYQDMDDFVSWLKDQDIPFQEYMPRWTYGDYMLDRIQELSHDLKAKAIYQRVTDITWLDQTQQWQLVDQSGQSQDYDQVHLCCGDLPAHDFYHLLGQNHYIHNPYPLQAIPMTEMPDQTLTVIGTGLAAIDVLKYCLTHSPQSLIQVFSLNNYFPTIRGRDQVDLDYKFLTENNLDHAMANNQGHLSFNDLDQWIQADFEQVGVTWPVFKSEWLLPGKAGLDLSMGHPKIFGRAQALFLHLSNLLSTRLATMTVSDYQAFKDHYMDALINLRNPMPKDSALILLRAFEEGRLKTLNGIDSVQAENQTFHLLNEDHTLIASSDWVINATGYGLNDQNLNQASSIFKSLINKGYVQFADLGGLAIDLDTGQTISPELGPISHLLIHGTLINGQVFQNNSTIKIQAWADKLIKNKAL